MSAIDFNLPYLTLCPEGLNLSDLALAAAARSAFSRRVSSSTPRRSHSASSSSPTDSSWNLSTPARCLSSKSASFAAFFARVVSALTCISRSLDILARSAWPCFGGDPAYPPPTRRKPFGSTTLPEMTLVPPSDPGSGERVPPLARLAFLARSSNFLVPSSSSSADSMRTTSSAATSVVVAASVPIRSDVA